MLTFAAGGLRLPISGGNLTGELSVAVLARPTAAAAATLMSFWDATTERMFFALNASKQPRLSIAGTAASGGEIGVTPGTNEQNLYGVTKGSGSTPPRWHHFGYTEQIFHHADDSTSLGNPVTQAGGTIRIGEGGEGAFAGDIAAAACWSRKLSDAEFELLAFDLGAWVYLNPAAGMLLDPDTISQKIADFTGGGANESSRSGLSIASTSCVVGYGAG